MLWKFLFISIRFAISGITAYRENLDLLYYHAQTKLREGNVFTPVCDLFGGGVSQHATGRGCLPLGLYTPRADPPRWPLIPHPTGMHSCYFQLP